MARWWSGPTIGAPSSRTRPVVGGTNPATIRSRLVFPQPDGPTTQTKSPSRMASVTRSRAATRPSRPVYSSVTSSMSRSARAAPPSIPLLQGPLEVRGVDRLLERGQRRRVLDRLLAHQEVGGLLEDAGELPAPRRGAQVRLADLVGARHPHQRLHLTLGLVGGDVELLGDGGRRLLGALEPQVHTLDL